MDSKFKYDREHEWSDLKCYENKHIEWKNHMLEAFRRLENSVRDLRTAIVAQRRVINNNDALEVLVNHGIIQKRDCDRSIIIDELVSSNITIHNKINIDTPDNIETSEELVSKQSDKIEPLDLELQWDEEIVFDHLNIDTQVLTVTVDLAVKACTTTPFAANTLSTQCECTVELMGLTLSKVCEKAFIWKTSEEFSVVVGNEDASERPAECKGRVLKMPWDPGVVYQKDSLRYSDTQENEQFSMRENFSDGDKRLVGSVFVTTLLVITGPVEQPILQLKSPCGATVASNFNEKGEVMAKDFLEGNRSIDDCLPSWQSLICWLMVELWLPQSRSVAYSLPRLALQVIPGKIDPWRYPFLRCSTAISKRREWVPYYQSYLRSTFDM